MIHSIQDLEALTESVLSATGVDSRSARVVSKALVYAETSGIRSHGLSRLPYLADQVKSGKIHRESPMLEKAGDMIARIDGRFGFGYVAATVAAEWVISTLQSFPLAVGLVSNSHHFGVAGRYTEMIGEKGYVGIAVSNTFGAIAPAGGRRALLGNDPISGAFPRGGGSAPVVIDLAPAVSARGNIMNAQSRGESIPDSWALDADGQPTTDPTAALSGSLRAIGGGKGAVLAMLLDLVVASTTTSNIPNEAGSVFTAEGPVPGLGHLVVGLDPVMLGVADYYEKIERYLAVIAADGKDVRIPGERRRENRAAAVRSGVEIDDSLYEDLVRRIP